MAKLSPPTINGKLPAQVGDTLRIPYLHNRIVGEESFTNLKLKIKTITTNTIVAEIVGDKQGNFTIENNLLNVGQYYKAQLAYMVEEEEGYYSTVGVFKYTAQPTVSISDFVPGGSNTFDFEIIGEYQPNDKDKTELDYSYCFNLYEYTTLIETSGEQLHDASADDASGQACDKFIVSKVLNPTKIYTVQYIVTTQNGLVVKSPRYQIRRGKEIAAGIEADLKAKNNYDNGYIDITLYFAHPTKNIKGQFQLLRYSNLDDYSTETIIQTFLIDDNASNHEYYLYRDFTVQQGVTYSYAIQQFGNYNGKNVYAKKIFSNNVFCDFEDIFLYDGERQLKVRFDPKISSFKNTILESKLDTIGGQYPFFFRNGRTKYKEFPISGLISYQLDDNEMFISKEELMLDENLGPRSSTKAGNLPQTDFNTNLTSLNILAERIFKLKVLEWLNNGKPKVFRSPTEGNYVVRLMNISLSPNDTLGRMLHSFNSTAYEIAPFDTNSLNIYKFIGKKENRTTAVHIYNFNLTPNKRYTFNRAEWGRIVGARPGSKFELYFEDIKDPVPITIGSTGYYESFADNALVKIEYLEEGPVATTLDIEYTPYFEFAAQKAEEYNLLDANGRVIIEIKTIETAAQFMGTEIISSLTSPQIKAQMEESEDGYYLVFDNKYVYENLIANILAKSADGAIRYDKKTGILTFTNAIGQTENRLNNILFLRLELIPNNDAYPEEGTDCKITFLDSEEVIDLSLKTNDIITEGEVSSQKKDISKLSPYQHIIAGRLELTSEDFNGTFTPTSIQIGKNVRADIYYIMDSITTIDPPSYYKEEDIK